MTKTTEKQNVYRSVKITDKGICCMIGVLEGQTGRFIGEIVEDALREYFQRHLVVQFKEEEDR